MIRRVLAVLTVCLAACGAWGQEGQGRSVGSLSGMVEVLGRPVRGARVTVWAAHPQNGIGTRCRFDYPEVGRHATTNEFGAWTIEGLDESMVYELIVASDGAVPIWVQHGDPRSDEPIDAKLLPRLKIAEDDPRAVRGRVIDELGQPVVGALVVRELIRARERDSAPRSEADRAAITDLNGEFVLVSHAPCDSMFISVFSKDHAKSCAMISCGSPRTEIVVHRGGYITGRLTKRGVPVPGFVVAASTKKALAGFCADTTEIATDENGRFAFSAMPAVGPTVILAFGEDAEGWRLPPHEVVLDVPGGAHELGDIEMQPAWVMQLDISLAPEVKLPEDAAVDFKHQESPIFLTSPILNSGAVQIRGVVPGVYQVTIRGSGIELDPKSGTRIGTMTLMRVTVERDAQRLAVRLVASDDSASEPVDPTHREIGGAEGSWPEPNADGGER